MIKYANTLLNALLIVGVLALAGCNVTLGSLESGITTAAGKDLLAINTRIAKLEPTVAAFIQRHLAQADVYFQQIAATGVIAPSAIQAESAAVASVNKLASNLPTTAPGVAALLAQAFTTIQNLTTVVGQ